VFQRVSPKAFGACGRLVVIEHGGQLLSSYLDEPFEDRAELALQLLSLVRVLWVRMLCFFTAQCFASTIWAVALCFSLSVTSQSSAIMPKCRITQTMPHNGLGKLGVWFSGAENLGKISIGASPTGCQMQVHGLKWAVFDVCLAVSQKRCETER